MIKPTIKQTAADSNTNAPVLHFYQYVKGTTYKNDGSQIDFVTDGKSLYVCAVESVTTTKDSLQDQDGMLKLVSQGEQGVPGVKGDNGLNGSTPVFDVKFDGKQLIISENGVRKAVSADLTGPSWKPVLDGSVIKWERTYDTMAPENIDLNDLTAPERPILLRTNSDNTKRSDETSGPAVLIQWKYEGQEEWTNLMTISELMNLALAGVSFWKDPIDGKYHFGHREVIKASYDSTTNGRKIISDVVLGDILFDAGEITLDYDVSIQYIYNEISDIKSRLTSLENGGVDLTGYATEEWVENKGYLTSHQPLDDYATKTWVEGKGYLTSHQQIKTLAGNTLVGPGDVSLKTINGESLVGTGDITVSGGGDTPDLTNYATKDWVNDKNYVRSVNNAFPDSNGNVNITVSGNPIVQLRINNNLLQKKSANDSSWVTVGSVGGDSGCEKCWSEDEIQQLIEDALNNLDLSAYVTMVDLTNNYYTKNQIDSMLADIATATDVDYYRIFTLYQRTNSRTVYPAPPVTGNFVWDTSRGEIILKPTFTSNWENHPQNATPEAPYLWMASATYSYKSKSEIKGDGETEFWKLVCLTGEPGQNGADGTNGSNGVDGTDGADGSGVEFIYTRVADLNAFNNLATPVAPAGSGADDIPAGWNDHPEGVTPELAIEAGSMRTYDGLTKSWSAYCAPFIWSMWGEDGVDGDGVEYIFCITADPSIGAFVNEIPLTDDAVTALGPSYQVNDWLPNGGNGNWTDNPLNVNEAHPYEWVAVRKYNGSTKKWGPFSDPKVWGLWGQKTITINNNTTTSDIINNYRPYTCYAFTRSNLDLTGYSVEYTFSDYSSLTEEQKLDFYNNPLNYVKTLNASGTQVSNITWYDTIPNTSGQLWLITNHIGDEGDPNETAWNGPVKWGDNAGFQIEYAVSDVNTDAVFNGTKVLPSLNAYKDNSLETIDEAAWRQAAATANCGSWSDDIEDPVYMATAYKKGDGNWSNWTVSKIKGEKGDKGDKGDTGPQGPGGSDGADGENGINGNIYEYVYFRTKTEEAPLINKSYGKYPNSTGRVAVDETTLDFLPANDNINSINGGVNRYWSDHPLGINEEDPYEWMAFRMMPSGSSTFTTFSDPILWSAYGKKGKDGDGVEYIFHRSETESAPGLSQSRGRYLNNGTWVIKSNDYKTDEWLPCTSDSSTGNDFWSDDPSGVDSTYKYEYVSVRKYNGETGYWGDFSTPALWSTYVSPIGMESIVTLDLENSQTAFKVDENRRPAILTTANGVQTYRCYLNTGYRSRLLGEGGKLIDWETVHIGRYIYGSSPSANTIEWAPSASVTIANYSASVDKNIMVLETKNSQNYYTAKVISASANQNRFYEIGVELTVYGNQSYNAPIIIPVRVTGHIGEEAVSGIDYLQFNPVKSDKIVNLSTILLDVLKKDSSESTDYGTGNTVTISGYVSKDDGSFDLDTSFSTVSKIRYSYEIDDLDAGIVFNLAETPSMPEGPNAVLDYYFAKNGAQLTGTPSNYFAHMQIKNNDDNQGEYDDWFTSMTFNLQGSEIIDHITFGVGYVNSNNPTEITDSETVYVIYPGKDGRGVVSIEKKYCYSSTLYDTDSDDFANWVAENGTLSERNDSTHKGEYCYILTIITYTSGNPNRFWEIEYVPDDGANGIPYTFVGEWSNNHGTYYNNSQRIDIVKYENSYYICNKTHGPEESFSAELSMRNFVAFEGDYENIATGFLFADNAVIQNLKVAEVATANSGERITINAGGANGHGDNAILGYSESGVNGITISGSELPADVFAQTGNANTSAGALTYYFKETGNSSTNPYECCVTSANPSKSYILVSDSDFTWTLGADSTSVRVNNGPSLSWSINGTSNVSDPDYGIVLPDITLTLVELSNGSYIKCAALGTYAWNVSTHSYNFNSAGAVVVNNSKNYRVALIPTLDVMDGVGGTLDNVLIDGQSIDWGNQNLMISASSTTIFYEYGKGSGKYGVTIAPNGLMVYFNENNYLQFVNVNGSIVARWKSGNIDISNA